MEDNSVLNDEVKLWLKSALSNENLQDFSAKVLGSTEKGDGYIGDVLFVDVTGTTKQGATKEYNLVLKCSKRSVALRQQFAVKTVFLNEIHMYESVFAAFTKFQLEKNIKIPFDSVPKCYGTYVSDSMEVLVLQNLKKIGYELWDRRTPLNLQHSLAVVREYGKYHALSVAFQDQKPKEFEELLSGLEKVLEAIMKTMDVPKFYAGHIEYLLDALKGDVDAEILARWKNLIGKVGYVSGDLVLDNSNRLNVITHGDCWSSNFIYLHKEDKNVPSKISILDWQLSRYTTPIMDLSYFLFTTTSEEGFENFDKVLEEYHGSFSDFLQQLGSDPKLYPFEQFMADWRKYCTYGIMMCHFILKMCLTAKEDIRGIDEVIENGEDIGNSFSAKIKNTEPYLKRMKYIIKYVLDKNLI